MKVVITGATGNVGTSVIRALAPRPEVEAIIGLARRVPEPGGGAGVVLGGEAAAKLEWRRADVAVDSLDRHLRDADVLVHLAWLIQPSRDGEALRAVNVEASQRAFEAAARNGVGSIVYASSVGAYSPGPKDRRVDESWPTGGISTSFYSRHKAEVESILDRFEPAHPDVRVVRLRPGLIFKEEAATEIRRLFLGPFVPERLLRRRLLPIVPRVSRLVFQAVHSLDVGEAYALAVAGEAAGAFNIAAEPVLDPARLGELLDARTVGVPAGLVRGLADVTWRLRLQPTPPGWLDMARGVPLMDTSRARAELGWEPRRDAGETLLELLEGMSGGEGFPTPPLDPASSGPLRSHELRTGVGRRTP